MPRCSPPPDATLPRAGPAAAAAAAATTVPVVPVLPKRVVVRQATGAAGPCIGTSMITKGFAPENGVKVFAIMENRGSILRAARSRSCGDRHESHTRPGPASASRRLFPGHVFQDARIGEVAEEHDVTVPDPEDLDGR